LRDGGGGGGGDDDDDDDDNNNNNNKGKGKFHPRTGHEGPEGGRDIALLFI
jgi:hypothetical protein